MKTYGRILLLIQVSVTTCLSIGPDYGQRVYDDSSVKVPEQWFTQKLDHFNPADDQHWQQRFYTNDTFYQDGGPVFLFIGGEGALAEILARTGAWVTYAQKYNALFYALEHRFYGKSHPMPDVSVSSLQYLTVEQALQDLATFITVQKHTLNKPHIKWIVIGGSYPGSLAAYMRYKFPHLVTGALAHSAIIGEPVIVKAYTSAIGESLRTIPDCFEAVRDAFDDVRSRVKTDDGSKYLQQLIGICPFDRHNGLDVAGVLDELMSPLSETVQYSGNHVDFLPYKQPNKEDMCHVLTNTTIGVPLKRLVTFLDYLRNPSGAKNQPCSSVAFNASIAHGQSVSYGRGAARRLWFYQMCTQLGNFVVSSTTDGDPFGETTTPEYYEKSCQGIFGSKFNMTLTTRGHDDLMMDYGGLHLRASNIIFTQGSFDPYRAYGLTKDDIPGSRVIYIQGVGHTGVMAPPSSRDNQYLRRARSQIQHIIGEWLTNGRDPIIG